MVTSYVDIDRGAGGRNDTNETSGHSGISWVVSLTVATTASLVALGGLRWYNIYSRPHRQSSGDNEDPFDERSSDTGPNEKLIRQLQQQRKEERTGRIRAEVRLRTTLKQLQQLQLQLIQQHQPQPAGTQSPQDYHETITNDSNSHHSTTATITTVDHVTTRQQPQPQPHHRHRTMLLNSIGTVITPYTKRMGTPRQGALVPASRGYIQFHPPIPSDVATGLEYYSHIWILFEFHANTDLNGTTVDMTTEHPNPTNSNVAMSTNMKTKKSKIRPPRGNGIKVGQLATRSPHRPNPIGLSLCKVERWEPQPHKRLYISGLDLVNGTPVYDIKPVVPWDVPGYYDDSTKSDDRSPTSAPVLRVPDWVSSTEDVIDTVTFTTTAQDQLHQCIQDGHLAPLYTNDNNGLMGAISTIQQILAQDPRSSHKGLKSNARGSKVVVKNPTTIQRGHDDDDDDDIPPDGHLRSTITKAPPCYSLVFCYVKVSFAVTRTSGCQVTEVIPIEFDANQYVDGVPIITKGLMTLLE